jgi:hypothetical protein
VTITPTNQYDEKHMEMLKKNIVIIKIKIESMKIK